MPDVITRITGITGTMFTDKVPQVRAFFTKEMEVNGEVLSKVLPDFTFQLTPEVRAQEIDFNGKRTTYGEAFDTVAAICLTMQAQSE